MSPGRAELRERLLKGSMMPEPSAAREQQIRCLGRATSFLLCPHMGEKETIAVLSLPIRPLPSPGPHPHDLSPPQVPPHLLTHTQPRAATKAQSPGDPLRIWGECTPASFAQAGSREHVPCQASAGQAGLATHWPVRGAWQRENRPQPGPGLQATPGDRSN